MTHKSTIKTPIPQAKSCTGLPLSSKIYKSDTVETWKTNITSKDRKL